MLGIALMIEWEHKNKESSTLTGLISSALAFLTAMLAFQSTVELCINQKLFFFFFLHEEMALNTWQEMTPRVH